MGVEEGALESKIRKKQEELERTEKRLRSLDNVRPQFMEEQDKLERELQRQYDIYMDKYRQLDYIEAELEKYHKAEEERRKEQEERLRRMREKLLKEEVEVLRGNRRDDVEEEYRALQQKQQQQQATAASSSNARYEQKLIRITYPNVTYVLRSNSIGVRRKFRARCREPRLAEGTGSAATRTRTTRAAAMPP